MYESKTNRSGEIQAVEIGVPFRRNIRYAIPIAAVFIAAAFLVPTGLKRLLSDVPVTIYVTKATRSQQDQPQTEITVNYQIASTSQDLLVCKLRLLADSKFYESKEDASQIYKGINDTSGTFSLPGRVNLEEPKVRLECSAPWTSYETDWVDINLN